MPLEMIALDPRSTEPLADTLGPEEPARFTRAVSRLLAALDGGTIWNVSSTARGGGVAELLRSLVAYAKGAGVDCRWATIDGDASFFHLTKGIHNAMHGSGAAFLGAEARASYERIARVGAEQLCQLTRAGDVVILHDPQTVGLAPALVGRGLRVIWRCHIGSDHPNEHADAAVAFLQPYLKHAERYIFTRRQHVIPGLATQSVHVIAPTIDPLSPKNQPLSREVQRAILAQAGLADPAGAPSVAPAFRREDGERGLVRRAASIIGRAPAGHTGEPLVAQISRWDRLKDHIGVLAGFAQFVSAGGRGHLILAGPDTSSIADDPEGAKVLEEVVAAYRTLPDEVRCRVTLATLPMSDAQENAAIVNALQRHAAVVVQKSLQEGFGLTVAEAMWKAKPVIASRVGGIQDQIEHGTSGLLLDDPRDWNAFAELLRRVTAEAELAHRLGSGAQERVRNHYLSLSSLHAYADVIFDVLTHPRKTLAESV